MAKNSNLKIGDSFTIRWLDADRTYDADEGTIVHIMETENFKLDQGHIWIAFKSSINVSYGRPSNLCYIC